MKIIVLAVVLFSAGCCLIWYANRVIQKGADADAADMIGATFALIFGFIFTLAAILMPAISLAQLAQ
jgi:drug/metabolite transporter (DMT)-like permease